MDFSTLKALKPADFETAADGYRKASSVANGAKESLERQITAYMRRELKGEARDEALTQLSELSQNFHYIEVECGLVSTSLNALTAEFRAVKKRLDAALEDAEEIWKFKVNPDGSVTYPAAGEETDGKTPAGGTVTGRAMDIDSATPDELFRDVNGVEELENSRHPNPNYAAAVRCANSIAQAVADATEIDERWAPKLRQLKADDDLTVSDADWADAKQDMGGVRKAAKGYLTDVKIPSKDSDPASNAAWWKDRSKEEQEALVSLYPASVGALDGLPAEVRDSANRVVLQEDYAETQIALAEHKESEPKDGRPKYKNFKDGIIVSSSDWDEWEEKRTQLEGRIKGMEAIQNRFNRSGEDGLPEAYLLGFSSEGRGRAIIANGNPDTADHTAVYVPGTGAKLADINGQINRGVNLWQASDPLAGGQKVSTITWLGYDAPQDLLTDATRDKFADDGAPAFNKFIDGLNATNKSGSDSHITAVAHSYGTLLIGHAASHGDLNADDAVLAGSPGVDLGRAEDLDVPKGHVWSEYADGDPVPNLGRPFHGGSQWKMGGGTLLVPSDEIFGANRMATDTDGHGGYWNYDHDQKKPSLSILNQAQVITGHYGKVALE